MEKLTFIEDTNGDRSVIYGEPTIERSNKVKVRTVSSEEFNMVVNMEITKIIKLIDDVLDFNTLNIDEK